MYMYLCFAITSMMVGFGLLQQLTYLFLPPIEILATLSLGKGTKFFLTSANGRERPLT